MDEKVEHCPYCVLGDDFILMVQRPRWRPRFALSTLSFCAGEGRSLGTAAPLGTRNLSRQTYRCAESCRSCRLVERFVADLPAGQSEIQLHIICANFDGTAGLPAKRM
jgi:hypothetical protein